MLSNLSIYSIKMFFSFVAGHVDLTKQWANGCFHFEQTPRTITTVAAVAG